MKKLRDVMKFQKMLQRRLGEDVLLSLTLEGDDIYLLASIIPTSDRRFKDSVIQRCKLTSNDLDKPLLFLVNELINIFEPLIEDGQLNKSGETSDELAKRT